MNATLTQTLAVNRPTAITWHHLKMNDASLDVPASLAPDPAAISFEVPEGMRFLDTTAVDKDGALVLTDAFEHAIVQADAEGFWETGMGAQAEGWLLGEAARHLVLEAPEGMQPDAAAVVHIDARGGASAVGLIDIIARAGSHMRVVVACDSATGGSGVAGSLIRVLAAQGAHVELEEVQTLRDGWKHLDDVGIYVADDARVDVSQTVLGGAESYVGLAANLYGTKATCNVDTHYLGHHENRLDFNYVLRQRGRKTTGKLDASGVLSDASKKTLRGTIDLISGCKGSVGRQTESVLLLDGRARNKTIPVILCDEDDVQGDHGATIGHVNPEQLEYMRTRGLSEGQIERLFMSAAFDRARVSAQDQHVRENISRLADEVLGKDTEELEGLDR